MPTRNEATNVRPLFSQIIASGAPIAEIVFVDGESSDGTCEIIRSLATTVPIRLLTQARAVPGLAASIMSGARVATGEWLLVMDADLSHPPGEISRLLAPLIEGTADLVIGSRYIRGGSTPGWPFWRRVLSRTGSLLAFPLTGAHDSMSGFFAVGRRRLLGLAPSTSGFKLLFEVITKGIPELRIREIPIAFQDRARGQSKMSFRIAVVFFCRWASAVARRAMSEIPKND